MNRRKQLIIKSLTKIKHKKPNSKTISRILKKAQKNGMMQKTR